jgi:putative sterol carrier protein
MFPIDIPAGTTVESLFTDVYPALHRKLVSASSGGATREALTSVVRLEGGGPSYTIVVRGKDIDVNEGEAEGAPLWVTLRREVVERFLEDWMGPKKYVPKTAPPADMVLLSDPRVMRRLAMVSARVELALTDFEGERVSLTAGCGDVAKKGIDPDDPDVVIEATMDTLTRLVGGDLSPEEALVDGHVAQRGKRLVAMQLALALAPFFPARR